jgi:hypothetical protein
MGTYTEILIKTSVTKILPADVEAVLQYLFNDGDAPGKLPAHPFFECGRWRMIGRCSSYYHIPWSTSRYAEERLFSRSDLKNYDGEVNKFFDWLMPYIDEPEGKCVGYSWHEEADAPALIRKKASPERARPTE